MRFSLESGFNEDQFRWSFISEADADAMGAAAAGADYGGSSSSSSSSSSSNSNSDNGNDGNDRDDYSWSDVVNDPDWGVTAPTGGGFYDSQEEAAASYNYGFGVPVGPTQTAPVQTGLASTVGVLTPEAQRTANLASGLNYTSPSFLSDLLSPRSLTPQQAISKMGIQGMSPYRQDAITFASGQPTMTFDPLGGVSPVVFNVGRTQQQLDERSFLERAGEAIGDRLGFTYQNQRAGLYDPMFDRFNQVTQDRVVDGTTYLGSSRLDKVSDNPFTDLIANALAAPWGSTVDTATYVPATGGPEYTYQSAGGLLGMLQDPTLRPTSEIEAEAAARQAGMGGDGDQPLIIPQEVAEVDEETGEPTAFPAFTPREYTYQPYTGRFYTIPSRFTKPYGLLG